MTELQQTAQVLRDMADICDKLDIADGEKEVAHLLGEFMILQLKLKELGL